MANASTDNRPDKPQPREPAKGGTEAGAIANAMPSGDSPSRRAINSTPHTASLGI